MRIGLIILVVQMIIPIIVIKAQICKHGEETIPKIQTFQICILNFPYSVFSDVGHHPSHEDDNLDNWKDKHYHPQSSVTYAHAQKISPLCPGGLRPPDTQISRPGGLQTEKLFQIRPLQTNVYTSRFVRPYVLCKSISSIFMHQNRSISFFICRGGGRGKGGCKREVTFCTWV